MEICHYDCVNLSCGLRYDIPMNYELSLSSSYKCRRCNWPLIMTIESRCRLNDKHREETYNQIDALMKRQNDEQMYAAAKDLYQMILRRPNFAIPSFKSAVATPSFQGSFITPSFQRADTTLSSNHQSSQRTALLNFGNLTINNYNK